MYSIHASMSWIEVTWSRRSVQIAWLWGPSEIKVHFSFNSLSLKWLQGLKYWSGRDQTECALKRWADGHICLFDSKTYVAWPGKISWCSERIAQSISDRNWKATLRNSWKIEIWWCKLHGKMSPVKGTLLSLITLKLAVLPVLNDSVLLCNSWWHFLLYFSFQWN